MIYRHAQSVARTKRKWGEIWGWMAAITGGRRDFYCDNCGPGHSFVCSTWSIDTRIVLLVDQWIQAGRFEQRLGKNWLKVGLGRQGLNAVTRKERNVQAEEAMGNTEKQADYVLMKNLYLYRTRSRTSRLSSLVTASISVRVGGDKCWSDSAGICATGVAPCIMYNVIIGRHPGSFYCPLTTTIHSQHLHTCS